MKSIYLTFCGIMFCITFGISNSQELHEKSIRDPYRLSQVEINIAKQLVKKNNYRAAIKLGQHYSFIERDKDSALYWYSKASDIGSIEGMIKYSYIVNNNYPDQLNKAYEYLMLLSSLGVNTGKKIYIDFCTNYYTCDYSTFYHLVELVISDADEYSYLLMCYYVNNREALNGTQISLVSALYNLNKKSFRKISLCGSEFYSDLNIDFLKNSSNTELVKQITDWLKFYVNSSNINTKLLKEQEYWFEKYRE